jgi:hypothetical protein
MRDLDPSHIEQVLGSLHHARQPLFQNLHMRTSEFVLWLMVHISF